MIVMDKRVLTEITTMCMVYQKNKILVQNRVDPKWPGICFPGGHVENGESFTESVIREVLEETGLTIRSPILCGIKQWQNDDLSRYIVLFYKTDDFDGQIISSDEGECLWIDKDKLNNYKLAKDFEDMYKIFENDSLSEFFYRKKQGDWIKEFY